MTCAFGCCCSEVNGSCGWRRVTLHSLWAIGIFRTLRHRHNEKQLRIRAVTRQYSGSAAAPHSGDAAVEVVIVDSSDGSSENVLAALRDSPGLQIITHCSDRTWSQVAIPQPEMSRLWYVDGSGFEPDRPGGGPRLDDQKSARFWPTSSLHPGVRVYPRECRSLTKSACRCIEKVHEMIKNR